MDNIQFPRSQALNNIPKKKLDKILYLIESSNDDFSIKAKKITALNRFAESNIPVEYWNLKMEKDFIGDPNLKNKYDLIVSDLEKFYIDGKGVCLAGQHGLGKTLTVCCILKFASLKGYTSLYTTLSDAVSTLISAPEEQKFLARKELMNVDFLFIDEIDPRFISSESSADLFGRTLETIFRVRAQNKLPIFMATNSPNVKETFTGSLKESIDSLMNGYMEVFYVDGKDYRKLLIKDNK